MFSLLHHYMNPKYAFENHNGRQEPFFSASLGEERNCINYAFAAAILSGLREENRHRFQTRAIAALSLLVSIAALVFSLT